MSAMEESEDTFKLRVNKIFGSLSSNSSPGLSSLWSLTGDAIEKIEWGLDKTNSPEPEEESTPYPSNLDGFFSNQRGELKKGSRRDVVVGDGDGSKLNVSFSSEIEEHLHDLDDGSDGVGSGLMGRCEKPEDCDEDEWEIRSSIGLDCTLDYEEEEDEYDKVAVGRPNAGDRVFMKEVNGYGICSDSYTELPVSFSEVVRDTHEAAKLRLKEDTNTNFDSLTVSDTVAVAAQRTSSEVVKPKSILKRKQNDLDVKPQKRVRFDLECKNDLEVVKPKSILKRKQNDLDVKPQKRVRFDPECKNDLEEDECSKEMFPFTKEAVELPEDRPLVPDYLQNPSKYTCYTFDSSSSEVDEEANRQALMDFFNLFGKPNATIEAQTEADDVSCGLPRSVTFTPRKKNPDVATITRNNGDEKDSKEAKLKKVVSISITAGAGDVEESEVSAMDEDEGEPKPMIDKSNSSRKSGRRYRFKVGHEMDDTTE